VAISEDGSAARYAVVLDREPLTAAAIDVVRVLEERIPGLAREAGLGSADVYVGGQTAIAGQTVRFVVSDLWRIGAVTLLVNLILLALFLRALVAPVLLLAASVLSFGAALGITTVVFEDILGYGELTYYVPFAAAVLLIALGSEYNVFIAGRIWHEAQRRRLQEAMAIAAPTASKSILVAGVTLAMTFALLALVPVRPFREFAFLLALGVILDAVVVRSVLVPGLISLAGRWAFWPGRPIVRVEREQFLAALIERAGIDPAQGGDAALATATTLGERISAAHARVLAARLPADVGEAMLSSDTRPETFSAREFVERVAQREQVSDAAARARIHGFSAALADATGDGELERLRAGLPPEYDDLLRR
jgi:RND superfamily putative drug exporter